MATCCPTSSSRLERLRAEQNSAAGTGTAEGGGLIERRDQCCPQRAGFAEYSAIRQQECYPINSGWGRRLSRPEPAVLVHRVDPGPNSRRSFMALSMTRAHIQLTETSNVSDVSFCTRAGF
jgi:hypothetical protein